MSEFRVETDLIEEWGSMFNPLEFPEYYAGLKRYYVDDRPVSKEEFLRLFSKALR